MRSRSSREAPEVNKSGGSHGRSRWQSAEILRYCMACPPVARCRGHSTLFILAEHPPRPHAVPASYALGASSTLVGWVERSETHRHSHPLRGGFRFALPTLRSPELFTPPVHPPGSLRRISRRS